MEILTYTTVAELAAIGDAWDRLSEQQPRFVSSFSELRHALGSPRCQFRAFAAVDNSQVIGIACFVYSTERKNYFVAEFNLVSLRVRVVSLFDSCVLGDVDEHVIGQFLKLVMARSDFDLLDVGYAVVGSPLYKAVRKLGGGAIAGRVNRADQIQWLIRLPKTFDAYVRSLGTRTRSNDVRQSKKLDRRPEFEVHVIERLDQIDQFLRDAEVISRRTYQWHFHSRFCSDEEARERLVRLAKNGALRSYIAYFDGHPCAFADGERWRRTYVVRQIGFDPQYARHRPGTALTLRQIRDLIENTDCEFLDFGAGGYFEYKTRFGNTSLTCARLQVAHLRKPYSVCLILLDGVFNSTKRLLVFLIERGKLMPRIERLRTKWVRRRADRHDVDLEPPVVDAAE